RTRLATALTYSRGWFTNSPTGVTNGNSRAAIARARYGSMNRGLFGQKTKPIALAPASTAASASSRRVMPQIFTNIRLTPTPSRHNGHDGHEGPSLSFVIDHRDRCVPRVLRGDVAAEQLRQRDSRIGRRHQALSDQKRAIAERAQAIEIACALQAALA